MSKRPSSLGYKKHLAQQELTTQILRLWIPLFNEKENVINLKRCKVFPLNFVQSRLTHWELNIALSAFANHCSKGAIFRTTSSSKTLAKPLVNEVRPMMEVEVSLYG